MTDPSSLDLTLADPDATARLGAALAGLLRAGDTVLLSGGIGAGKTHLARSVIQAMLAEGGVWEEVPSPTFTLMQSYETPAGEVIHADLYRLSGPGGLDDIGLSDLLGTAICLVEWPDRLGGLAPADALWVEMTPGVGDEARVARLSSESERWRGVFGVLAGAVG